MQHQPRTQRGVSVIEAMVAFLILSMGLLAFARIQSELRFGADLSRQRAEATRLAQEDMEQLRAYSVLPTTATAGITSFDEDIIATVQPVTLTLADVNTTFRLTRTVNTEVDPITSTTMYRTLQVQVAWEDRRGASQNVTLNSAISRLDPRDNGKVTLAPPTGNAAKNPLDRDVRIPISATDLGNRNSGFTPPGQSGDNQFFWVFDSDSGNILKKCIFGSGNNSSTALSTAVYANATCTSRPGYLLKGFIRFDLANNPSSEEPGSTACDFYEKVLPGSATQSHGQNVCAAISSPTDLLSVQMPDSTTGYSLNGASRFECHDDFKEAVRNSLGYVNYYCAIYVQTAGNTWSGKSTLVNVSGWLFGTTNSTSFFKYFRNCRYSADYSGNGSIDQWEHPYSYSTIGESLTAQNFLLVNGNQSCPTASANIGNTGLSVSYRTCRHQPAPSNTSANTVSSCDV